MRLSILACSGALLSTLACGGGASSDVAPAITLNYTNPTTANADWQLVKDSTSSTSRLVLDLMAPTAPTVTSGQGITLILTTDTSKATWATFSSGSYVSGLPYATPLLANKASVNGSALRIVVAQNPAGSATYSNAPVLQVALNMASGAAIGSGSLTVASAYHLSRDATSDITSSIDLGTIAVK
jgi:hypothetical protein